MGRTQREARAEWGGNLSDYWTLGCLGAPWKHVLSPERLEEAHGPSARLLSGPKEQGALSCPMERWMDGDLEVAP